MLALGLVPRPPEAPMPPAPAPAFPAFIAFAPAFIAPAFAGIALALCVTDADDGEEGKMMFADDAVCMSFNGAEEDSPVLWGEVIAVEGEDERRLEPELEGEDSTGRGIEEPDTERGLGLEGEAERVGAFRVGELTTEREGLLRLGTEGEEWRVGLTEGREPAE